jgi:branched-chain amino acid transport system ATP-binding protein
VSGAGAAASAAPGDVILRTDAVGKTFGKFTALNGVSASFRRGALTSIIGPNGAGKSTYFNLISGAFPPSTGRVEFEGRDITGTPQHRYARLGIAKSFQITTVFPQITVAENVRVALQALVSRFDVWRSRDRLPGLADQADALLESVGLRARRARLAGSLAHGEQRALEIAMALASRPRLLLLDEPTAGMSPEETRGMMDLIVRLASERTVILVEHKMKLVMGISDRLLVLHHGELLAEGTPDEIRRDSTVKRVYLGQREH